MQLISRLNLDRPATLEEHAKRLENAQNEVLRARNSLTEGVTIERLTAYNHARRIYFDVATEEVDLSELK